MTNESIKEYKKLLYNLKLDAFNKRCTVEMILDAQSPFADLVKLSSKDEMEKLETSVSGVLYDNKEPFTIMMDYVTLDVDKDFSTAFSSLSGENKQYTTSTTELLKLCIYYNSRIFAMDNRGTKSFYDMIEEETERRGISKLG